MGEWWFRDGELWRRKADGPALGCGSLINLEERKTKIGGREIMARGKIQIKRIENETNRQVTYSKRRKGLFKKAHELTVLCDAKVSLIMISSNKKLRDYVSPSTTTKQIFDQYQHTMGVDLWSSHYERMQEELKKLKDVNRSLRREIRHRRGESLIDLNLEELYHLEQNVESAVKVIRDRKYHVIGKKTDILKKKKKRAESIHKVLLHELVARDEDPYGLVDNGGGDYCDPGIIGCSNTDSCMFALRLQPNFHMGEGSDLTTYTLLE
ncbi:agamous-like MADS-box protein AP3 isoform X2 [Juglans microcarpa x Juglans regia]|uniref:agamous-like MADS-box protein AP3 isoform X2 n=1 Tax=Juglans microcarpa x Juglans regia TaxID=2249226 RepID=UPI001B7F53CA|nr:agamous-like MADS-box protein AP3 isoform X2 [Juglans microcarpa x Juglans regia]